MVRFVIKLNAKFMVKIIGILIFLIGSLSVNAQRILQLEIQREVDAIKFYEGESIVFKSAEFPKDWQEKTIERIIVEDGIKMGGNANLRLLDVSFPTPDEVLKPSIKP